MLRLEIPLAAKPQGSKKAFTVKGRTVLVEASKGLKERRGSFIQHIRSQAHGWSVPDKDEPLWVEISFYIARPKTVKRPWMTTIPDLDKLIRFTLDCLTQAGVIEDDRQIVNIDAAKTYADKDETVILLGVKNV
jgi:Holliday junction resolvase RusA-like endonuclease